MEWAALIAWVVTAGGGFVLLAIWLSRGGMRQGREPGMVAERRRVEVGPDAPAGLQHVREARGPQIGRGLRGAHGAGFAGAPVSASASSSPRSR